MRRLSRDIEGFSLSNEPRPPIIRTRWVLLLAIAYTVLFGSGGAPPVWPHQVFIGLLLLSNLALMVLLATGSDWKRLRWGFTAFDVAAVTITVNVMADAATNIYLVFFAVLLLATVMPRMRPVIVLTVLGIVVYGTVMYLDVGADFWRAPEMLVRLPMLLAIALYFGTVVQEARVDQGLTHQLAQEARQIAQRAKQLAKEQYRLQALTEIGRLGLTGVRTSPGNVLFEISQRVQKVVGVDRCSLVIFEHDGDQAYLAASGDDPSVEVRVLAMEDYPELQAMLRREEITELYPHEPAELWKQVQQCLPASNPFRAFLIVPIQRANRLLGAFYLRDVRSDRRFGDEDRNFCWTAAMMTAAYLHGHDMLSQLRTQSRRDGLTGLLNFQAFTDELDKAMLVAKKNSRPLSVIVADLDNLKDTNDKFGHTAGNRLIITAGHHFAESLNGSPAICRYGGDEFVGAFFATKFVAAEMMSEYLAALDTEKDLPRPPRASIGIAEYPSDGSEPDELMDAADQAMYLAKNEGGHGIRLAGEGLTTGEWKKAVLEAVVSVQARRYLPDEERSVREILAPLEAAEGQALDSPLVRQTLQALMEAVESKDPHTHAHSKAVADLARKLAAAMELPHEELTAIEIAGLVHDVGKIGVPAEILGKSGKLSSVERQVMERHPEIAAQLLQQIPPLRALVPLVFHHQERWDGSGYPAGLRGEEIPPGAHIIAICDAYDALTSSRAFRSALTPEEAGRVLQRDAGRLWSPDMIRVFLDRVASAHQPAAPTGPAELESEERVV